MKKTTTNYLFSIVYQMLSIIIPLITTPYISRVLGVSNVGYNSYVNSILNYFTLAAMFGTYAYGQKEIGAHQNDKKKCTEIFFNVLSLKMIIGAFVSAIYALTITGFFNNFVLLFEIRYLSLLAVILDISWFFQGMENFKITVIRQFFVKIVGVILIFICVKGKNDLYKYVLIDSGMTCIGAISIYPCLKRYLVKLPDFRLKPFSDIKGIVALFIPQIATSLYASIDKTMIGAYYPSGIESGYYEQAYKIETIGISIVIALTNVLIPRLAFFHQNKDWKKLDSCVEDAVNYIIFLGAPLALGISGISFNVLPWFLGDGYYQACNILQITALLVLIMGLTNFLGFGYLVATNQQKLYTISVGLGTAINIILNSFLIPHFGALGAAYASVVSETCVLLYQFYKVKTQIDLKYIFRHKLRYLLSAGVMAVIVTVLSKKLTPTIVNSAIILSIGLLVYFTPLFIIRDVYLREKVLILFEKTIKR